LLGLRAGRGYGRFSPAATLIHSPDTWQYRIAFGDSRAPPMGSRKWGMIIMFVLMAIGLVWFVVRQRRRVATA
jgi:hypothetical protein